MNVNGTLINYYFHCKRQCYLHGNRINLESNSIDVEIGKTLHKIKSEIPEHEVKIDNISIDKIGSKYVTEYKKSDSDILATKMQLLYYLKVLKNKGIIRKGKIIYLEKNNKINENKNNNSNTEEIIELDEKEIKELNQYIFEIEELVGKSIPPEPIFEKKCSKCAYYTYCFL